jgi:hypothetical protein
MPSPYRQEAQGGPLGRGGAQHSRCPKPLHGLPTRAAGWRRAFATARTDPWKCRGLRALLGFRCYLPRFVGWVRTNRTRHRHPMLKKLFAGYLFVGFGSGTPKWQELLRMPGVVNVLGDKHRPHLIEFSFLAKLAQCETPPLAARPAAPRHERAGCRRAEECDELAPSHLA